MSGRNWNEVIQSDEFKALSRKPSDAIADRLEKVAKAIAATHGWDRDNGLIQWKMFEGEARAAIAALGPNDTGTPETLV